MNRPWVRKPRGSVQLAEHLMVAGLKESSEKPSAQIPVTHWSIDKMPERYAIHQW